MELQTLPLPSSATVGARRAGAVRASASTVLRSTQVRRLVFFTALLAAWELLSRFGPWPDYLMPGPLAVGRAIVGGLKSGLFLHGTLVSMARLLTGYGISLVGGVLIGTLLVRFTLLRETLGALIVGLQALPSVCWLPLAILWFGLSERAITFVVVMGSLFSIILGVQSGIANTSPIFVKAARNLGASGVRLYTDVVLPAAFPTILAGLKQGWAFAWRSLMAAELLYFSLSLGNLLQTGRDLNDAAQVMAVMVLIIAVGVAFNQLLFAPLERRVAERWGFGATGA
ncbi:MAG TPA: ABC transporter permease [Luteitalea sp.]|nr:ABC transporter permease [Luteitalea sp.]